jgi:hypothetical protein
MGRIVRNRWLTRVIALVVIGATAGLPLIPRGTALAHPLGNFTVNRYARVELYRRGPRAVRVDLARSHVPGTARHRPQRRWGCIGVELAEYAGRKGEASATYD